MMAAQAEATILAWRGRADPPVMIVRPPTIAESTFQLDLIPHYVEEGYRATVRELFLREGW
jgi:chorismate synthase